MNPIYRFFINDRQVFPVYKDDLAKEYELETNQRFYRAKLSGKISFVRGDFDFLDSQPFDTEFMFEIHKSDDIGLTWDEAYFLGVFMKTDGKWDADDKIVEVQPDARDEYTDVLAGLDKEYDLIKITPEIQPMYLKKRPLIQIYVPGDSVVSCFLGGTYWEQDANATTDLQALEQDYYFALCNALQEVNLTVAGSPTAANGLYTGRLSIVNDGGVEKLSGNLTRQGNATYRLYVEILKGSSWFDFTIMGIRLIRNSDDVILHEFSDFVDSDNDTFTLSPINGTGNATAEMTTYRTYARYLLDVETIQGLSTYPIPSEDIVENNRNYTRAIGYSIDVTYISMRFSPTPTEWGRADNGEYFLPPASIFGDQFFPIARSTWRYASIWFAFHQMDWFFEESGRKTYLLRDTFPVASCISRLLAQFAPGITHEETPDYSQFLYGSNPITLQNFRLLVTQKTNLIYGNYDQPAQKAVATLQQFTAMLRDCFRAFWFIDDGKFRIEHVQWFRNGGTYSGGAQIGVDLRTLINVRNGKPWAFHSSAWEFDKIDLAERYQFKWMDDVTPAFEGVPIEILSKYVTPGKIEDVNVSGFTTDVDFMILNPGSISEDGFALFSAIPANGLVKPDRNPGFDGSSGTDGQTTPRYAIRPEMRGKAGVARFQGNSNAGGATGQIIFFNAGVVISTQGSFALTSSTQNYAVNVTIPANADEVAFLVAGYGFFFFYDLDLTNEWELPFVTRTVSGINYIMQNGNMSWPTLQPNYYVYDLPARNVMINGEPGFVIGVDKKRKQQANFPSINDPDALKLMQTYLGVGQVDKISINLHSRMNKVTLKYDTE